MILPPNLPVRHRRRTVSLKLTFGGKGQRCHGCWYSRHRRLPCERSVDAFHRWSRRIGWYRSSDGLGLSSSRTFTDRYCVRDCRRGRLDGWPPREATQAVVARMCWRDLCGLARTASSSEWAKWTRSLKVSSRRGTLSRWRATIVWMVFERTSVYSIICSSSSWTLRQRWIASLKRFKYASSNSSSR